MVQSLTSAKSKFLSLTVFLVGLFWLFCVGLYASSTTPDPREFLQSYLQQGKGLANSYLDASDESAQAVWVDFIGDGGQWLSGRPGDEVGRILTLMALYSGQAHYGEAKYAGDASRILFTLKFSQIPELAAEGRADFIRVGEAWLIRSLELIHTRPITQSDPESWARLWVEHLQRQIANVHALDDKIPRHRALGANLASGWGFWEQTLSGAPVGIYAYLSSVEPEEISFDLESLAEDAASVVVRTAKERRTFVQSHDVRLRLLRDERGNWMLKDSESLQPVPVSAPVAAAPQVDMSDRLSLVQAVLEYAATPMSERGRMQDFAQEFEAYFIDSREARRSAGILSTAIAQFSSGSAPVWSLSEGEAGVIHADLLEGEGLLKQMFPAIDFVLVEEAGVWKVGSAQAARP